MKIDIDSRMCTGLINSREIQCSSNNPIIRHNSGMSSITVGLQDTFDTLLSEWMDGWIMVQGLKF